MDERWNALGGRLIATIGLLAGALAGAATFAVAGSAVAQRGADSTGPFVEATHLPPLLTTEGELVDLSYDAYCIDSEVEEAEEFVRSYRLRVHPLRSQGPVPRAPASE